MLAFIRLRVNTDRMTDTPAQRVGRNVRAEMARNGLTQDDLASRLRLTQPAVSRRLTGDVPFNVNELALVSRAVGVSLSRLVAGTERPRTDASLEAVAS